MTTTKSTDSGISQRTNVYAEREMLKHQAPVVVLDRFGMTKPMPKNKSVTIKFRRPLPFTASDTPLVEGITPTAKQFRYEDVSGTLKQYGEVIEITDVIEDTHEDPVLNDAAQQCGENIGRTQEALAWGVLKAGTNVFFTNGTVRTSVNTALTLNSQRAVVKALDAQKAMMITKILDGSPNYGTRPIEASFVAVTHTDMKPDIRNMSGFIPVAEYGTRSTVHEREIGSVEDCRYVLSPDLTPIADAGGAKGSMTSTSGTSADVYPILYFGKESYGYVPLRGQGSVSPSIIPVNQRTKDDVLGQRGYVGWKMWFLCLILNQAWMARLESAATAL